MYLLRNAAIQVINVLWLHWLRCLDLKQATSEHTMLLLTMGMFCAGLYVKQDLRLHGHQSWSCMTAPTSLVLAPSVISDRANVLHHVWGRQFVLSFTVSSLVLCSGKHLIEQSELTLLGSASFDVLWCLWVEALCCSVGLLSIWAVAFQTTALLKVSGGQSCFPLKYWMSSPDKFINLRCYHCSCKMCYLQFQPWLQVKE